MSVRVCLAATCHDPAGRFAAGVSLATDLWDYVDAVAVNRTDETHASVVDALRRAVRDAAEMRHPAGSVGIGAARREALGLALTTDCSHVVYSDLDHVLRWSAADAAELRAALSPDDGADLVVIGRSEAAFAQEPARLRLTEAGVNAAVSLATGIRADYLIAVRLMTREVAAELVAHCAEDSIGTDVAWPLHAQAAGFRLASRSVGGLAYRHRDDFGAERDRRDEEPGEWVHRLRIAAEHAEAMWPYLAR